MAASATFAEDELGRKWDKCLTDAVLKMGGGLLVGSVVSLLFFKRRSWPIILGTGFGIGMAYANCERDLNSTITCDSTAKQTKGKK
ncbi:MICOS complex subunit MIC10-like [Periplaneta americana]|uniref:MICOS complex subunit MIC10-like n=1 Tax=Periplaneta americana TaxID=6978 RepID=UPI0037E908D8